MKRFILSISVFISGASVMIVEIAGARLLAPTLGTSTIIWTSLIGIVLGALSLGYIAGGKLADTYPSFRLFTVLFFLSSISVGLIYVLTQPVLQLVDDYSLRTGSILAVSLLFGLPSVLFGMISPFAIRLALQDVEHSGNVAGGLYAISTIGSIVGTFASGFWLLPLLGTSQIILYLSYFLFLYSIVLLFSKKQFKIIAVCVLCGFVLAQWQQYTYAQTKQSGLIAKTESQYNSIEVYQNGEIRYLKTGQMFQAGQHTPTKSLVFPYTRFYSLDNLFKPDISSRLLLGGGGYTVVEDIFKREENAQIDVVEIDPEMTRISKEYFGLEERDSLHIHHEDARSFLNRKTGTYDVIYADTFLHQLNIPFHLATKEATQLVYDHLNDDGFVIINVISATSGEKNWFLASYLKTLQEVFPTIYSYGISGNETQELSNIMVMAFKSENPLTPQEILEEASSHQKGMLRGLITQDISHEKEMILTDDFAPIDYYVTSYH